jgi:D-glycero-alpha-D-manno-heptose-7-phosphate kinase
MIVTRTPLRVTLGGGGTDLASYYHKAGGFIFGMALNKYVHVGAHRPQFDRRLVINGEPIDTADAGSHPIVRAALEHHGITERFEISSLADIGGGTGMGSSSTFLVGLLNALHTMNGKRATAGELAEEACDLEITALSRGIGKQDQYMAAFGGLTTLDIAPDGKVEAKPVEIDPEAEREFIAHTHIYYTGLRRDAAVVLADQNTALLDAGSNTYRQVSDSLDQIKDLGHRILHAWKSGDVAAWGRMLDEHWQQKKRLGSRITWPTIDALYDTVRARYGVTGGKIIGAGGGGFMMLFCEKDGVELQRFMADEGLPRLDYAIDRAGTQMVYHAGHDET